MKIAAVVVAMCPQAKETYGIRIEKQGDTWVRTWAFPVKKDVAEREHFESTLNLSGWKSSEGYPGCPYCRSNDFIQCGRCHKLYCYHGESKVVCPFCGNNGEIVYASWDDVTGGGY